MIVLHCGDAVDVNPAAQDHHHGDGPDQGVHLELGAHQAIGQAGQRTQCQTRQHAQRRALGLVDDVHGHHAHEGDQRADGQVHLAGDQQHGHADAGDHRHGAVAQDVEDVGEADELGVADRDQCGEQNQHQHQDELVEQDEGSGECLPAGGGSGHGRSPLETAVPRATQGTAEAPQYLLHLDSRLIAFTAVQLMVRTSPFKS